MLKPSQIKEKDFSKSTMGGYKTAEVDSFLDEVAASYEQLYKENSELLKKLRLLVENIEDYRKREQEGTPAADNTLAVSKQEADRIINNARLEAQCIVADARKQAEAIEAGTSSLNELIGLREKEEKRLADIRAESERFRKSLLSMYTEHLTLIQSIVDGGAPVVTNDDKAEECVEIEEGTSEPQSVESDEKPAYDDIDVFFAEAVSQEQSRIKEAFGGFRFEMGAEEVVPEPEANAVEPVIIGDDPLDEQEDIHIGFTVDCSVENDASQDNEDNDELKPNFKISFPEDEESSEADEENLDDLFAGFFNAADKSE